MPRKLIIDSSSLIALERADLLKFLDKIGYEIIISEGIMAEVGDICKDLKNIRMEKLNGRSLRLCRNLEKLGMGRGEAECIILARKLKLDFIVCDDKKLMRQIFFSRNRLLKNIKLLGFSFFLHLFYKNNLIEDVWKYFDLIIKRNNWKRGEVQIANYTFLKELGY